MKRFKIHNTPGSRIRLALWGLAGMLFTGSVDAQTTVQSGQTASPSGRYSLRQCIEIALQNNITVRQGELQVQNSDLQLRQAKLNRIPTLNAFGSQALSSGRNINPATNTFVTRTVNSNNYQLSSSATIYNGMALNNTIKQNDLYLQSTAEGLKATQNNVSLTVAQNYLNVLTYEEQLDIARRQVEASRGQLERTQRLVSAGTLAEANLFDLRAQVANDEVAVVNAQSNLDLAKVALLQTMNLPAFTATGTNGSNLIEVERYQLDDPTLEPYANSVQQVYESALQFMPDVKSAELRVKGDALGVQVAKAALYPSLTISGSLSTLYSSVGLQRFVADGTLIDQQVGYVTVGGTQQPVYAQQPGGVNLPFSYGEQLKNNLNRSFSLNLRIPIFNNMQARNRITSSIITQKTDELAADNTRLLLRQNIETAYSGLNASLNRYRATQVQVTSLGRAFQAAESRYNVGALNAVDYNIAKTNLDKARANLVAAKYDYIFRTKILDFYQNKPLAF